ncbi:MAG: LuxR C-terminal-related transcriptional regulator [Microbacteriaceae bacterium]
MAARVLVARGASEAESETFRRVLEATSGWPTYPVWASLFEAEFAGGGCRERPRCAADHASRAEFSSRAGLALTDAPRATSGVPELTAQERQVLDLIAQGLSNRQTGERLFISAKTASVHVSAILRKLGPTSRTEAAFVSAQGAESPGR